MAGREFKDEITLLRAEISKLKEVNRNLSKKLSENELWGSLERVSDAILFFDEEGTIQNANQAFLSYLGQNKEMLIGRKLESFVPPEQRYKLRRQNILLAQNGKAGGLLPIQHEKGVTYFEVITSKDHSNQLNISIMRDVTRRRMMKDRISKNEELVKELFLQAVDGIIFWDLDGKAINANSSACRIFECSHHELIGTSYKEFLFKKGKQYYKVLKEINNTGASCGELFFLMGNGQKKLIEFTCRFHSGEGYYMTIFRDVSDRYRIEQELRESELKCRKVFEGSLDGMLLWGEDFLIMDANSAAEQILCLSREKIIGKPLDQLIAKCPIKRKDFASHFELVKLNGRHDSSMTIEELDGTFKHFEYSTKYDLVQNLNLTVIKDVTEKIELQEQLRKSDTLNVIGELAAGIAHEIRNPMTALKGFIQLLKGSIKEEHSMYYNVITSELQRIDTIINEFLILAKPQAVRFQESDLTIVMKETVELLGAQAVLHNVQFKTFYEPGLPHVFCEPNQLKKVFINIIKNAIEVMPDGGNIKIHVGKNAENKLHICIQDQGMGMSQEKIKKLGEPFYTTKERGTGLGLMVSYRIIEEHHGSIKVESEEGVGSTFHILLPLLEVKEQV